MTLQQVLDSELRHSPRCGARGKDRWGQDETIGEFGDRAIGVQNVSIERIPTSPDRWMPFAEIALSFDAYAYRPDLGVGRRAGGAVPGNGHTRRRPLPSGPAGARLLRAGSVSSPGRGTLRKWLRVHRGTPRHDPPSR
jgi:hypothetical protein